MKQVLQPKASLQQKKMFFALCKEASVSKSKAMNRALELYQLKDFADISPSQISPLIDALQKQVTKKEREKIKISNSIHARVFDTKNRKMLYSKVARVGHDQGVLIYFPLGYEVPDANIEEDDMDIMLGSGKYDVTGREIFRYDIFINKKKEKFMVDISEETLQWIAIDMKTDEKKPLHLFSRVKVVGSVYEDVHDQ